jgi:hypothetical protein
MRQQTKHKFITLSIYKSNIILRNAFNSQLCLNGFLSILFPALQQVSSCSLIYLHIPQTNINSSNVAEVPVTLISSLPALMTINDMKRMKASHFYY